MSVAVRTSAPLEPSANLLEVLRRCEALAERESREGGYAGEFLPRETTSLRLADVNETEARLGTVLPDDLWIVLGLGIPGLARSGFAATTPHGDPAQSAWVSETVLTMASDAEGQVPDGLVAVAVRSGESDGYVCVRVGSGYGDHNETPVVVVRDGKVERETQLGDLLREDLTAEHGQVEPVTNTSFAQVVLTTDPDATGPRIAGPLIVSEAMDLVLRKCQSLTERARERGEGSGYYSPDSYPELSLEAVGRTEETLQTALPDDFWAAAAYGIAGLELLSVGDHGDPAPNSMVPELITTTALAAAKRIPSELVAVAKQRKFDYLCVVRGTSFEHRNAVPVVMVNGSKRLADKPFTELLLARLGNIPPVEAHEFPHPRLVSTEAAESEPQRVTHPKFGVGTVRRTLGEGDACKVEIEFDDGTTKTLLRRFVRPA